MEVAVLIPGIMGTKIILPGASSADEPEELWPPTPLETQFGYKRIDKLQDPRAVAGGTIDKVLCFSFYQTIKDQLQEIGYTSGGMQQRLVEFPYDWRQDNFTTAKALAARLDQLHPVGATGIRLIGHSMGGLVARLVLESGTYDARPWFKSINLFLALATPHLGAPLALARIFGLDSNSWHQRRGFRAPCWQSGVSFRLPAYSGAGRAGGLESQEPGRRVARCVRRSHRPPARPRSEARGTGKSHAHGAGRRAPAGACPLFLLRWLRPPHGNPG